MALAQAASPHIGILVLEKGNYAVWKCTIKAFATENDLTEHLQGNLPIPQASREAAPVIKEKAQAGRAD